jgi:multisubunit Na+/H+ antiporter MnhB subunit
VEAVTTVLFLLGLRWLPKRMEEQPGRTWRTGRTESAHPPLARPAGGLAAGTGMAVLSYALMTRNFPAEHLALLPGTRPARRRRHQRGQRDAGGLPRL